MKKKPDNVAESAASYAAKKKAKRAPAPHDGKSDFRRITGKLLKERQDLLHKLAQ